MKKKKGNVCRGTKSQQKRIRSQCRKYGKNSIQCKRAKKDVKC